MQKKFHAIGGLPRSGSTLLANLLNQNPRFYASDTSFMAVVVEQTVQAILKSSEVKSEMHKDGDGTRTRIEELVRGMMQGWYSTVDRPVVFDKDRKSHWLYNHEAFTDTFKGVLIITARDPRECFASFLKRRKGSPLINDAPLTARTLVESENHLFSPGGAWGLPILAIEDIIRKLRLAGGVLPDVFILQHEALVQRPQQTLNRLYEKIGEEPFEHDVENVVNVAGDLDALYLDLWPHEGCGAVEMREPEWPKFIPQGLADRILKRFPLYCSHLGYH